MKFFIFLIIGFLFLLPLVSAQSNILKLELCKENKDTCFDTNDKIIVNPNAQVILRITFINDLNAWMCWSGLSYRFKVYSDNIQNEEKTLYFTSSIYGDYKSENPKFCFSNSNREENIFYIPIQKYNTFGEESKLGKWFIRDFSFSFDNLEFYNNISIDKPERNIAISEFNANEIEFNVKYEELKKGIYFRNLNIILKILFGFFNVTSLGLSSKFWYDVLNKKKNKPYIKAILFSLVTIILTFFGVGNIL